MVSEPGTCRSSSSILNHLRNGARGIIPETPKIGDPRMRGVKNKIIANSFKGLQVAAAFFKEKGMRPVIIGDGITGEAKAVAQQVARKVRLELSSRAANRWCFYPAESAR